MPFSMKKGFTLVELLVSVGIFSVVILIAVSALLTLSKTSERSYAILTAINNLDFATEHMSRTLRTGVEFYCTEGFHPTAESRQDCPWGRSQSAVSFTDYLGHRTLFRHNRANGTLERIRLDQVPQKVFSITSPQIFIEDVKFNVEGSAKNDAHQPKVMIRIKGITDLPGLPDDEQVEFDLQTTITQRNPNF